MTKGWKSNPLVYLFSKAWFYSKGNRKKVVCFWVMFIMASCAELFLIPFTWAKIMDVVQKEGITRGNFSVLVELLMFTLFADVIFWAFHGPARLLERDNAFKARANYKTSLLKGIMNLPMFWHVDHHSGDTIDKIAKGTEALHEFSEGSFGIVYSVVQLVGSYIVLSYFSRPAAYIVLAMIFVTVWITMRFDRVLLVQYEELNHAENSVSESVFDAISNITTVIILRVEKLVYGSIEKKIYKPYELQVRRNRLVELKWFLTNMCCTIMVIIVMIVYFWQNTGSTKGTLVASVYLLTNYLGKISELFFRFTSMYGEILRHKASVLNSEELTKDFRAGSFTSHVLPKTWRQLEVQNLYFSYRNEGEGNLHLENVSVSIRRGERIAFVGETGSGKTTLLKIMRDLYSPRSLELRVDGQVISQGFEGISQAIALVPQNPEIFATTIRENITLGVEYDMEFVTRFTDMACFTDVALGLPKQFDSQTKEKGVNLSGGEQQRLALSRGLLACHEKEIVLLDEPTSSLDSMTEMKVYQNLFREFHDKTIVSSVHRLHLLPLFHRIYVFNDGRVVASGTLVELLEHCPEFQELWKQCSASTND